MPLRRHQPLVLGQYRLGMAAIGLIHLQLREALDALDDTGAQPRRSRSDGLAGRGADAAHRQRQGDADQQRQRHHDHRGQRVQPKQQAADQQHGNHRDHAGHDHPQIDRIEQIDVGGHAVQQVAATLFFQPGRGQRDGGAEQPDPQARQVAEGGVMRYQPLGIARRGAQHGETADAGGRAGEVEGNCYGRRCPGHGRGGDEPTGQRQQAQAGHSGDDA